MRDPEAAVSALRLLINLGWQFLSAADALTLRGSNREVILKPRLIEVLKTRRFEYKGEWHPLSPSGIDQVVRQAQTLSLSEGLLPANERLYRLLTLGVTITEFMPDGRKHQPTIALIDWHRPSANRWDVTGALEVLSAHGTHLRVPDVVGYVNGLPLVVIEAKRSGIAQHLQNQRNDEIPQLYAYAQLLLAVCGSEARYGTTGTAPKLWARWREEAFSDAQLAEWKNRPLDADVQAALLHGKPASLLDDSERLRSHPSPPTEQDRLLAALLEPARLLEFLRIFVLFDRKVGKVVARYQQFFGVRAVLARIQERRPDGAREGGVVSHATGSGKRFTMVFLTKALMLHDATQACRVLVVTDRIDLEDRLARNVVNSGAYGSAVTISKTGRKAKVGSGRDLAVRIGQGPERLVFAPMRKLATASKLPECHNASADLIVLVDEGHRSIADHGDAFFERLRKALPRAACFAFTGTPLLKAEKAANKSGPIVHAYAMQRAVEDETVAPLFYEERLPALANNGTANRIELIAWDIARHFSEHIGALGFSLKGLVATASKLDAIRYKHHLDDTGLVSSAVLISAPDSREGDTEIDESRIPEVQSWWDANVGKHAKAYEASVLDAFGTDGAPDLLIVVDRLLAGFDEPRNTVLYIDKPLEEHDLFQAVARVNRLHEVKRHGVLVDYRGIPKKLDATTQGGYEMADIEALYKHFSSEYRQLPGLHEALWAIFSEVKNHDPIDCCEQYRQVLMPRFADDTIGRNDDARQKVRDDFDEALTLFDRCLKTALSSRAFFEEPSFSEQTLRTYKDDLRFFNDLRRNAQQDAEVIGRYDTDEGPAHYMVEVDKPVIGMGVREPEGAYRVHPLARPDAFRDKPNARVYLEICASVLGDKGFARSDPEAWVKQALAIDDAVKLAVTAHSLNPQDIETSIRKALLPALFAEMGLEKAKAVIEQVIRVTRMGLGRNAS